MLAPALWAIPASTAEWQLDATRSEIRFEYRRGGETAVGVFRRAEGGGSFDPGNPGATELTLRIDSASIDLFYAPATAFALSTEWFNARKYPEVVYRLTKLEPLGADRYDTLGDLTVRGRTLPVKSEILLTIGQTEAVARGRLAVNRRDYLIGYGATAFVDIGAEVVVTFNLFATHADGPVQDPPGP